MENRPNIKVPLSKSDKVLSIITLMLNLLGWIFVIWSYTKLPDIITVHFDIHGQGDNRGNKGSIIILQVIATLIYILLAWLITIPQYLNYSVKITEQNAKQQYSLMQKLLIYINLSTALLFDFILYIIYDVAMDNTKDSIQTDVSYMLMVLIFLPIVIFLFFNAKNKRQKNTPG